MPLGVAEKTTPIYSGFPRALLWGINPSDPGPQSPFGMENSPQSLGKSALLPLVQGFLLFVAQSIGPSTP